jgi:hypothetical protein
MGGFRNVKITNCSIRPSGTDDIRHWQQQLHFIGLPVSVISGIALESVDGAKIENVTISDIKMTGVQTPIFIVLGHRGKNVVGSVGDSPVGSIRDIDMENISAESYSKMPSSITGLPGHYIENVRMKNVSILSMGKGTKAEGSRELPENEKAYPENRMYGDIYPCSGFFIRHAANVVLENVILKLRNEDCRSNILLDDVHDSHFSNISMDAPSCSVAAIKMDSCYRVGFSNVDFPGGYARPFELHGTKSFMPDTMTSLPNSSLDLPKH